MEASDGNHMEHTTKTGLPKVATADDSMMEQEDNIQEGEKQHEIFSKYVKIHQLTSEMFITKGSEKVADLKVIQRPTKNQKYSVKMSSQEATLPTLVQKGDDQNRACGRQEISFFPESG